MKIKLKLIIFIFYILIIGYKFREKIKSIILDNNSIKVLENIYNRYTDDVLIVIDESSENKSSTDRKKIEEEIKKLRDSSYQERDRLEAESQIENKILLKKATDEILKEYDYTCKKECERVYILEDLEADLEDFLQILEKS